MSKMIKILLIIFIIATVAAGVIYKLKSTNGLLSRNDCDVWHPGICVTSKDVWYPSWKNIYYLLLSVTFIFFYIALIIKRYALVKNKEIWRVLYVAGALIILPFFLLIILHLGVFVIRL